MTPQTELDLKIEELLKHKNSLNVVMNEETAEETDTRIMRELATYVYESLLPVGYTEEEVLEQREYGEWNCYDKQETNELIAKIKEKALQIGITKD